jgi:hypothetical protein
VESQANLQSDRRAEIQLRSCTQGYSSWAGRVLQLAASLFLSIAQLMRLPSAAYLFVVLLRTLRSCNYNRQAWNVIFV